MIVLGVAGGSAIAVELTRDALKTKASELFCGTSWTRDADGNKLKQVRTVGSDDYSVPKMRAVLVDFWMAVRDDYDPAQYGRSLARMSRAYWHELTGTELDTNPKTPVFELSPLAVKWAGHFLVPSPSDPLCGSTAQQMYDKQFKGRARYAVLMLDALERDPWFSEVKGWPSVAGFQMARVLDRKPTQRLEQACLDADATIDAPRILTGTFLAEYAGMRAHAMATTCAFMLRRAADGSLPEVGRLLRKKVAEFDPSFKRDARKR